MTNIKEIIKKELINLKEQELNRPGKIKLAGILKEVLKNEEASEEDTASVNKEIDENIQETEGLEISKSFQKNSLPGITKES